MKITASENNVHIEGSAFIGKRAFDGVLDTARQCYPDCKVWQTRSWKSMRREWALHNALYGLGLWRSRTRDVDIDTPPDKPEWLYNILGAIVWPFIG